MSKREPEARAIAEIMALLPPSIRLELIARRAFSERFAIPRELVFAFDSGRLRVGRTALYSAIRASLRDAEAQHSVELENGEQWAVASREIGRIRRFELVNRETRVVLPPIVGLDPSGSDRCRLFAAEAIQVNLPAKAIERWQQILEARTLSDEEVDDVRGDLENTPVSVLGKIAAQLEEGTCSVEVLVPTDAEYYERLVGRHDGSATIREYSPVFAGHVSELLRWDPLQGASLALAGAAVPYLATQGFLATLTKEHLLQVFEVVAKTGDVVSQVGAIELGLEAMKDCPELETIVAGMIESIFDRSTFRKRLTLTSSLIVLVDGEMSRSRIFVDKPPFWRRLAAVSHAALIERAISASRMDDEGFANWAVGLRGRVFFHQTVCDLRLEPRWQPDFVSPQQLEQEFVGRVLAAIDRTPEISSHPHIGRLVLFEEVAGFRQSLAVHFPGPLEGNIEPILDLSQEIREDIESKLGARTLDTNSFISIVNSALLFRLSISDSDLARKALREFSPDGVKNADRVGVLHVLNGLAIVAAVTRNAELAQELKVLARRARRSLAARITLGEALMAGLVGAAAIVELTAWCEFVGSWFNELAFEACSREEIDALERHIAGMCQIVPELYRCTGRGAAALAAASHITLPALQNTMDNSDSHLRGN